MNTGFISFYYHLLIAFFIAAAIFYGLKWLAIRWRDGQEESFRPLVANILRRPLLTIPGLLFVLYSAHYWPGLESTQWHETLILTQNILLVLYPAWFIWEVSLNMEGLLDTADGRWAGRLSYSVIARSIQLLIVVTTLLSLARVFGYSLST